MLRRRHATGRSSPTWWIAASAAPNSPAAAGVTSAAARWRPSRHGNTLTHLAVPASGAYGRPSRARTGGGVATPPAASAATSCASHATSASDLPSLTRTNHGPRSVWTAKLELIVPAAIGCAPRSAPSAKVSAMSASSGSPSRVNCTTPTTYQEAAGLRYVRAVDGRARAQLVERHVELARRA